MPELQRIQVKKILGVTVINSLPVSVHVQFVIPSFARMLYALRVLRAHGLWDSTEDIHYEQLFEAKFIRAITVRIKRLVEFCRIVGNNGKCYFIGGVAQIYSLLPIWQRKKF